MHEFKDHIQTCLFDIIMFFAEELADHDSLRPYSIVNN